MAALDPDNHIKLFRLNDSQDSTYPENIVIIPAAKNVFQSMFPLEYRGHQSVDNETFPEEGVNLLLKFRCELDELFQDCGDISGIAAVLWDDISRRLFERGVTVTGKQCSSKWAALYSEYLEIAQSDDEGRVSGWKHFADFEYFYKLRSKHMDSKILEDITEYLNCRSGCSSISAKGSADTVMTTDERIETSRTMPWKKELSIEDFSMLNNEEDSQMLIEAINAAQKILEENLSESDNEPSEKTEQNPVDIREKKDLADNSWCRYEGCQKRGVEVSENYGETNSFLEQNKIDDIPSDKNILKAVHQSAVENKRKDTSEYQVRMHSEKTDFDWDADATQCFLDLRLHVESSREVKRSILRKYRTIVAFVSQKMLLNGYQVSRADCKKKWDQLLRYYKKEVKKLRKRPGDQNRLQKVEKYFWQMDKVLKKSGLEKSADDTGNFCWDHQSIRKLIGIRTPMENAFAMFKRYVILWQYVASQMRKHNLSPTYNECSIKWMELSETYNICSERVKAGASAEDIDWNFYQDMRQGFEQNAKSTEAVINYKCNTGLNVTTKNEEIVEMHFREKSTQSLASASTSGPEFHAGTKLDTFNGFDDSDNGNGTCSLNLETDARPTTLEIAVHHCNLLENILNTAESNVRDNVVGAFRAPDPTRIDNILRIPTLRISDSMEIEDNLLVEPAEPTPLCIEMSGASLLQCADASEVQKRIEQNQNEIEIPALEGSSNAAKEIAEATAFNDFAILPETQSNVCWTADATTLLIKLKISRELNFRSPSSVILEIDLWNEIAKDMQNAGHNVSPESCASHWNQLIATHTSNLGPENAEIIFPEYQEQLKHMELPFTENRETAKTLKKMENANSIDRKATRFVWTDHAIRCLLELRLSVEIRSLNKYGKRLANKMQAVGYPTITHSNVTNKWSSMYRTYRKSLIREQSGKIVRWQYFKLMNNYMNSLIGNEQFEPENKRLPFLWTPHSVQKLIDLKLLLENSCCTSDRKVFSLLWKRVADAMVAEGFQVTNNECANQWNSLVRSYKRTKKKLCSKNSFVIDEYFIMMDQALNKSNKSDNKVANIEEPIDFSITRQKRKLEDSNIKNMYDIGQGCSTMSFQKNVSATLSEKVFTNKEHNMSCQTIDGNVINLSQNTIFPPPNCSTVNNSSEIEEYPQSNVCINSSTDSSQVTSFNMEKELLPILRAALTKNQQEVSVYMQNESCNSTDKMSGSDSYIDSSKENVACVRNETLSEALCATSISKREDMQSRILCHQQLNNVTPRVNKAHNNLQSQYPLLSIRILTPSTKNILIQDRAVNSTENNEREETNERWSEAATHLLIDLNIQHNQKFPGWPRPEIQWDRVAGELVRLGYNHTWTECRRKWRSLKSIYEQKMSEIRTKKIVQAWPYFEKMDSFYKQVGNLYPGFRYILPKKRPHDDEGEQLIFPKKLAVRIKPLPRLTIYDTGNVINMTKPPADQEKMIE